jgi:agmatine deiminase
MTPDWETNRLFLSDRLEVVDPQLVANLRSTLNGAAIEVIPETSDIWCRDFMPVQLKEDSFCQFIYRPDYLKGFEHLVTPPNICRLPFMEKYHAEPVILDGGNIVASRTKVILTDKVYAENPAIERPRLRSRLEELFNADCIFIPKEPFDPIGHADGMVRFVAENHVLMNDYSILDPVFGDKLRALLERSGLQVETLSMFEEKESRRGGIPSAVGLYINYLRVGNVVVLPSYDRPEDQIALKKVQQVMPDTKVHQVPCRHLAEQGGVLNCVSWTIKRGV